MFNFNFHLFPFDFLFASIVGTNITDICLPSATPEQKARLDAMLAKFSVYSPDFAGPITPTESVKAVLSVIENASLAKGDGGRFLSHFGNRQWL